MGEGLEGKITALVLRIMASPTADDEVKLRAFADQCRVNWWFQTGGSDTAYPFYPAQADLHYILPEFGVRMLFKQTDFTQINHQINRVLVARALRLLDVQPG